MLPNIKILATGGTIAGSAESNTQMTGYTPGAISVEALIYAVPSLTKYANVTGEQVTNIGSHDIVDSDWLILAKRCNQLLAEESVDGLVVTHGTNTLEETAYFLNLTVKSSKPVVVTGAMRPATAISADGPLNILNAVRLAANKEAAGKGVLIALNDEINAARETTKNHTSNVSTFHAPEIGALGCIIDGEAFFYRQCSRKHTLQSEFDITNLNSLPQVEIIFAHVNQNRLFVDAAIEGGAKGIVYAGMGMGAIHKNAAPALIEAQKSGIMIVRGTRVHCGIVPADQKWTNEFHFIDADNLNPQKARILLMLALTKTSDYKTIQKMFHEY